MYMQPRASVVSLLESGEWHQIEVINNNFLFLFYHWSS